MKTLDCIALAVKNVMKFFRDYVFNKEFVLFLSCKVINRCSVKLFGLAFFVLGIALASVVLISKTVQNWDDDPDRGTLMLAKGQFGDHFDKVFPNENTPGHIRWQGWEPEDSMWFYTTTQGSNLIPYDFFMVLEQSKSKKLFRAKENIDRYRYIPLKPTFSNPDGLPLGIVKDTYRGKEYVGLTCAACHTNQINYKGTAIRVDGAPTLADMENFVIDLSDALKATLKNKNKRERFITAVMSRNDYKKMMRGGRNYSSEEEIEAELIKFSSRVEDYVFINDSKLKDGRHLSYGYGRLDAFGRIFNRALQHALNKKQIKTILSEVMPASELEKIMKEGDGILTDNEFDHIVERIKSSLTIEQLSVLKDKLFNSPNAPVSYPFLWDTPQHDYVQWNGIAGNSVLGSLGRNTGEVIGVFGTLDWEEEEGFSLLPYLLGQSDTKRHISYKSSANLNNLERLENHLKKLYSPIWPEVVLPKIDRERADRGDVLFEKMCADCHTHIDRTDPKRQVVANFSRVKDAGTDPAMATNALTYTGYSGITEKQYVDVGLGNLVMEEKMPVATILTVVTKNVVATPDMDKPFFRRWADFFYMLGATIFHNDIKASLKRGDYEPDTTVDPFASLMAYKTRPLNGIWATAPYLHNGSVPTLYELLLPKKRVGDPGNGEYRPDVFYIGSREFDPDKVGFINEKDKGSRFDTSLPGNSNAGHENYSQNLTKEQRWDLVEYMKTL